MKTVGEFKKAGLAFVKGDCGDNFLVKNPVSFNSYGASFEDDLVKNFSWRKNTGVKPDFSGAIEVLIGNNANEEHFICESASEVPWDLNKISRVLEWRPSLNQPSLSVESDTKESAIHKAWVDLKGDISNLLERDERSDIYVSLCIDGMGHGFFAGKYYGTGENPTPSMFEKICTIKEFTDYREKMAAEEKSIKHLSEQIKDINGKQLEINRKFKELAAEEKRMDIIGQNGNEGLHYDYTAQQVEALAINNPSERTKAALKEADEIQAKLSNDKPIFTQAMADAGGLPPVGSLFIDLDYNENKQVLALAHHLSKVVYASDYDDVSQVDYFHADQYCCRPLDTRTDREKAIDEIQDVVVSQGFLSRQKASKEIAEKIYDAGYRKC